MKKLCIALFCLSIFSAPSCKKDTIDKDPEEEPNTDPYANLPETDIIGLLSIKGDVGYFKNNPVNFTQDLSNKDQIVFANFYDLQKETEVIIQTGKSNSTHFHINFHGFISVGSKPVSEIVVTNSNTLVHKSPSGDITVSTKFPITSTTVYVHEFGMLGGKIVGEFIGSFQVNEKNNTIGLDTTYSDILHINFTVARLDYY